MALSPKDALHNQKRIIGDAVERVEAYIDERLTRVFHPEFDASVSIPIDHEAMNYMTFQELCDRLSATYRKSGWNVKTVGMMLVFSIPKPSAE